jgi:hypothetical protein
VEKSLIRKLVFFSHWLWPMKIGCQCPREIFKTTLHICSRGSSVVASKDEDCRRNPRALVMKGSPWFRGKVK